MNVPRCRYRGAGTEVQVQRYRCRTNLTITVSTSSCLLWASSRVVAQEDREEGRSMELSRESRMEEQEEEVESRGGAELFSNNRSCIHVEVTEGKYDHKLNALEFNY